MDDLEIVSASLSNRLKDALTKRGLAQEEAARRAGITYRHFNRVTLGHTEPSLVEAARIAFVLGVPVTDLFTVKLKTRSTRIKGAA